MYAITNNVLEPITYVLAYRTVCVCVCVCVYIYIYIYIYSRYCDKATGCTVRGSKSDRNKRFSCSPKRQNRLWGPPSHLFDWMPRFSPARKLPGRDVDHSPLPGSEVKGKRSCTSALPIFLHDMDRYILYFSAPLV